MLKKIARWTILSAFAASAFAGAASARELSYANHLPPAHPVNAGMQQYFEKITAETGGDLTFEMFVGGALGSGKALIGVVRDRLADTGFINPVYDPATLAAESVLAELMYPDPRVLVAAMNEMVLLHCPQCIAELEEINAVPLMSFAVPSFQLICNKPLKTRQDAAGTRVRAVGALSLLATELNMVPVNLTSDETYEGLQRGQIECAMAPFDWLVTNHLEEVATDVLETPLGSIGGLLHFAFNSSVWEEIGEDNRKAVIAGLAEALAEITFGYNKGSADALDKARSDGKEVYPLEGELADDLEAFQKGEVERVTAKAEELGIQDAEAMMETYVGLLEKWQGIVDGEGADQEGFARALRTEIYSKL